MLTLISTDSIPRKRPLTSTHQVDFAFPCRRCSALPVLHTLQPTAACRFEGEVDGKDCLLQDSDWLLTRYPCPSEAPGTEHKFHLLKTEQQITKRLVNFTNNTINQFYNPRKESGFKSISSVLSI